MALRSELSLPTPASSRASGFPGLMHFAGEYLLALPVGVACALVWSAVDPVSYYQVSLAASFPVNDVAMVFFFALMTKEVVEATAPAGVLHSWQRVAMPVLAAFAASVITIGLFAGLVRVFDEPMLERGWAAVLAVDVAFGYLIARVIFGRGPAIPFFLVFALAANGFGLLALGASESLRESRPWAGLGLVGAGMAVALLARQRRIASPWVYLFGAGSLSWAGMYLGGLHPALALLPIVPFVPHARRDPGFFVDAPASARDPLSRIERACHVPAQVALFFFGLVNGGLTFQAVEAGVWALPIAALAGRPAGLLLGAAVGLAVGLKLPERLGTSDLLVIGITGAVGFTMTLFFATAVAGPGQILMELRTSALISTGAAALALGAARVLGAGRYRRHRPD